MLAIGLGITMAVLDSAIANIALPSIAGQLHAAPAEAVWVINAYQLALVATLLPLASLGERIGYRRVYLAGLALFTIASLGCALSHNLAALVIARVLQGFAAAGLLSMNGALVRFTYPHRLLGGAIGLNALTVSVATAIGPTVASAILAVGSWEWLFAVNVPLGAVNLVLASRALPYSELSERRFDYISAALTAVMFGLFFIGVDALSRGGRQGLVAALELAVAIAAGGGLIARELKSAKPLIPIDLLKNPIFTLSVATSICSFVAQMLAFLALPFYFETQLHRDQVQTGLLMTPWPAAVGITAPLAGRLADRFSAGLLGGAGLFVLAVGLLALATLPTHATTLGIVWRVALCGLGFGFFQAPNNRAILSAAPRERAGAAGGMLATARMPGFTAGAAMAAFLFRRAGREAEVAALAVSAVFALLAATVSLLRRLPRPSAASATV